MILKMKLKNLFPVFWFCLVCFPVVSAQVCVNTSFFRPNQQYDKNRGLLLSSLASNVLAQGGFYNASVGQGSDRVYATGMCIQGAKRDVCSNCINLASFWLMENCPNQTEGFSWFEEKIYCMIHYSNRSSFGSLEMEPKHILYNTGDVRYRYNLTKFDRLWEDLTRRMIAGATSYSSESKYYAAETIALTSLQNIYALMQCTPLISLSECNICLNQCVIDFELCCHGKQGGIINRPSCVFRWEFYPFSQAFNHDSAPPVQPPTPLPPSVGNTTNTANTTNTTKSGIIGIIIVVLLAFMISMKLSLWFALRRRRKEYQESATERRSGTTYGTEPPDDGNVPQWNRSCCEEAV